MSRGDRQRDRLGREKRENQSSGSRSQGDTWAAREARQQPIRICHPGVSGSPPAPPLKVTTSSSSDAEGSELRAPGAARADRTVIGPLAKGWSWAWPLTGRGRGGLLVIGKLSHNLHRAFIALWAMKWVCFCVVEILNNCNLQNHPELAKFYK